MWQRRAFLKAAGAGVRGVAVAAAAPRRWLRRSWCSRRRRSAQANAYGAALVTETGKLIASIDLPDRGHDITYSPVTGQAVVFARQPGTFAVVFDPAGQRRAADADQQRGPAFLRAWRVLAGRQAALCHRE